MAISKEIHETLSKLPRISKKYDPKKLIAYVKLVVVNEDWEYYICEYNPDTKVAKALVHGWDLEHGLIELDPSPFSLFYSTREYTIDLHYQPEKLSDIYKRLEKLEKEFEEPIKTRKNQYDIFISYASEDEDYANKLVLFLNSRGIKTWYAPVAIQLGDSILKSIEDGMRNSDYGLFLLSKHYLTKNWTRTEFDTLIRDYIEKEKKIFPLWHGVTRKQIDDFSRVLSGLNAISTDKPMQVIFTAIIRSIENIARSRGVLPIWENPVHRFLSGLCELHLGSHEGPIFNIYEAVLSNKIEFPIYFQGVILTRKALVKAVASILRDDEARVVSNKDELREICRNDGFDPSEGDWVDTDFVDILFGLDDY